MSRRDETGADENRALQSEQTVGNPPARERREVYAEAVDADYCRRLSALESESAVGERGGHEQHEQRTQAVV
jgi:hypothetical protein